MSADESGKESGQGALGEREGQGAKAGDGELGLLAGARRDEVGVVAVTAEPRVRARAQPGTGAVVALGPADGPAPGACARPRWRMRSRSSDR